MKIFFPESFTEKFIFLPTAQYLKLKAYKKAHFSTYSPPRHINIFTNKDTDPA